MLKFITKTMCLTLVAVLCSWSLNAQELVSKKAADAAKYGYSAAPQRGITANCNPVQNLRGAAAGKTVTLNWDAPQAPLASGWATYSGENADAIGYTSGGFDAYIAARWTAGDLSDLNGYKITKFKYYVYADLADAEQTLRIWTGGTATTPGTQVYSHQLTSSDVSGTDQWIELDVPPITIDATKALWIGANYDGLPGVYCAPIDDGPAKIGFGDLISQNGGASFQSLYNATDGAIDGNWNLMVYITDGKKGFYIGGGERADVTGYKIFRNGTQLATTQNLTYTDEDLAIGEYRYCVSAIYDNGCESDQECLAKFFIDECEAPQNLELTETVVQGRPAVKLEWEAPNVEPETWMQRCGNPNNGIGGPTTMQLAVYFLPELLGTNYPQLHGMPITTFRFYPRELVNCTVKIWQGGDATAPGAEVFSKSLTKDEIDVMMWNEVRLDVPIILDVEEPLWIGYTFTSPPPGTFPAGCDAGPMVPGGAMVYDGGKWKLLTELNPALNYNWCMGVMVKGTNGNIMLGGEPTRAAVANYLLYRDGELFRTNAANSLTYTDQGAGIGGLIAGETYNYCVVAKYTNNCQSGMEDLCDEITLYKEDIAINELANDIAIYPNPATSSVNITGVDIEKVEIYNTMGQIVETQLGNVTTIDVSAYTTGVYFFKVYDANNNSVTKRVMVSR